MPFSARVKWIGRDKILETKVIAVNKKKLNTYLMLLSCLTLAHPVIISSSTVLIVSAPYFVNMLLFSSRLMKKPCVLLLPEVALANQIRACQIQKVLFSFVYDMQRERQRINWEVVKSEAFKPMWIMCARTKNAICGLDMTGMSSYVEII